MLTSNLLSRSREKKIICRQIISRSSDVWLEGRKFKSFQIRPFTGRTTVQVRRYIQLDRDVGSGWLKGTFVRRENKNSSMSLEDPPPPAIVPSMNKNPVYWNRLLSFIKARQLCLRLFLLNDILPSVPLLNVHRAFPSFVCTDMNGNQIMSGDRN